MRTADPAHALGSPTESVYSDLDQQLISPRPQQAKLTADDAPVTLGVIAKLLVMGMVSGYCVVGTTALLVKNHAQADQIQALQHMVAAQEAQLRQQLGSLGDEQATLQAQVEHKFLQLQSTQKSAAAQVAAQVKTLEDRIATNGNQTQINSKQIQINSRSITRQHWLIQDNTAEIGTKASNGTWSGMEAALHHVLAAECMDSRGHSLCGCVLATAVSDEEQMRSSI